MHRLRNSRRTRFGITIIEVLIVVFVVIACVFAWGVYYSNRAKQTGYWLSCSTRLNQVHKGMVLFANDFGGMYPVPMDLSPETAAIGAQTGNSSANFFSYMIFNTYYTWDTVICPDERNPAIRADEDFRYGIEGDVGWQDEWQWDPAFSSDFTAGEANSSYALLAPIGDRLKDEWQDTLNADFAVASDRGPKDGVFDSKSLANAHTVDADWHGHIAFNDGHVQEKTFRKSSASAIVINGDNLFFADQGLSGADMWLGVWGDSDDEKVTAIWD